MKALLLIAHGSRREASNEEVRSLAKQLADMSGGQFFTVEAAFLELAEPSIPDGVSRCVEAGAREVMVVPYFLSAGRHVVTDIPAELDKARVKHPEASVIQSDYLGKHSCIANILLMLANPQKQPSCMN